MGRKTGVRRVRTEAAGACPGCRTHCARLWKDTGQEQTWCLRGTVAPTSVFMLAGMEAASRTERYADCRFMADQGHAPEI